MNNNLWHSVMKRAAPIMTSALVALSSFTAKAQEQNSRKIEEKTPQSLKLVEEDQHTQQEKTPQLQMAEEMFSPELSFILHHSLCSDRDLVKDTLPAIHAFTEAQEKAIKQGLPTFQYDKQTFDAQNPKLAKEKFMEYYRARTFLQKEYSFMGKKFSTESGFRPSEQIKFYGNLNQEITQAKDLPTAIFIHKIASEEVSLRMPFSKKNNEERYNACHFLSLSKKLTKYYDLLAASGNPGVYPKGLKFNLIAPFINSSANYFSPNLLSGGNINLQRTSESTFISELAHAFRNKNNALGETGQFIADGLKDIFTFKNFGFTPEAQSKNYYDKGKMEYDAHEIVEPALQAYVNGKIRTIPEMHFAIDQARQKKGYSFTQAYGVKGKILQGKIDLINRMIQEKGDSKELQNLKTAAEKQLKDYTKEQQKRKLRRTHHHGGGGHGGR